MCGPHMTTPDQHARAMARRDWQCPNCPLGFQRFDILTDASVCPNCGYSGGVSCAGPDALELTCRIEEFRTVFPSLPGPETMVRSDFAAVATHVKVRISLCLIPPTSTTN